MTHEEAINYFMDEAVYFNEYPDEVFGGSEAVEATKVAIQALEKQIAKNVIVEGSEPEFEFYHYMCPRCKVILQQHYKRSRDPFHYRQEYCRECGQKLKWEEQGDG